MPNPFREHVPLERDRRIGRVPKTPARITAVTSSSTARNTMRFFSLIERESLTPNDCPMATRGGPARLAAARSMLLANSLNPIQSSTAPEHVLNPTLGQWGINDPSRQIALQEIHQLCDG